MLSKYFCADALNSASKLHQTCVRLKRKMVNTLAMQQKYLSRVPQVKATPYICLIRNFRIVAIALLTR